jgi:hypothetical protein
MSNVSAMPIFLSIALRAVYFCAVAFVAFWLGIGVAMGFDAGVNIVASLLAFLYLLTFIPALLLSITPLSIITRPPFLLKAWYWWVAFLLSILLAFKIYFFSKIMIGASSEITDQIIHSSNYGTICRQVIDAEPGTNVWFGIGSLKNGFSRESAMQGTQFCSKVTLSKSPFQVLLGDPQHPTVALDIPITGGGKTCIGLTPLSKGASPQGIDWSAKVISCTR